jgi:hypothetical protein
MACVYVLASSADLESIRYVGRSKHDDPSSRLKEHLWKAKKGCSYHVYNWIREVQDAGHSIVASAVVSELSWQESAAVESKLIQELRQAGVDLTNMTDGGEGSIGVVRSAEYREKLSKSHKGKVFSEEHKKKLGEVWKGRSHSEETKRRISESQKGRVFSEESRLKMSMAARKRRKSSD